MNRHLFRKTFWGIGLIGIGVVFMLNRMNLIDWGIGDVISLLWPLILLEIGLNELLFKCKRDIGGWIMTVLGVYFLGRNIGMIDYSLIDAVKMMMPLLLVLGGLHLIFNRRQPKKSSKQQPPLNEDYSAPPPPPPASPLDDWFEQEMERKGKPVHSTDYTKEFVERSSSSSESPRSTYGTDQQSFRTKINLNKEDIRSYYKNQNKDAHREQWKQHRHDWKKHHRKKCGYDYDYDYDPSVETKSGFIGDVHIGKDYFELKPMNISHFIGDTMLDLTKAQIAYGVTRIEISAFIGDVKVYIPSGIEVGIKAQGNSFIGDMNILGREREGMMSHMDGETIGYEEAGKQIELVVNAFIGDIQISRVG
ncbi:cell wall-active antibiotics response protein LiaF [Paenibacillus sp. KACC 21273]|uniref:cell wall-active antibiotics response protein LiaF n=1 Tax=Paenibacillus sp. KACC 21273 TaxID=3025665 RepID=UPI002367308D|nr:cell wall-active antibiotics response protein LiaF [Paenibacillus sp. KACC 21273]WDF49680.1 cell wall-active antibiotics response protein LiaF [Paenibacillus sp. KACC 21273]